jgi:hypothetical protein
VKQANDNYREYVEDQTEQLVAMTAKFAAAYQACQDDEARTLYPVARMHWEPIETVAESFGDLDPKLDLREADLEPGQKWTGWHRLEKDLWPARAENYEPLSKAERATYSADLVKNAAILHDRVPQLDFSADEIANGSPGLLDEVRRERSLAKRSTGAYLVVRRINMTIEIWDRQALSEQERVIGRTKAEGAPLSGGGEISQPDFQLKGRDGEPLVAADAHVRLVHPSNNGGIKMLRRGYNFVDGSDGLGRMDAGLFFLAYVRDPRVPTSSRSR